MVYNTWANSTAIVPRVRFSMESYRHIAREGAGGAVVALGPDAYVLAQLLLSIDHRSGHRPTNKATLFLWDSRATVGKWIPEEVVLPLPADEEADATATTSFLADMELALSAYTSISFCWVDLVTGVLVYKRAAAAAACYEARQRLQQHGSSFHFIPLPEGCDAARKLMGEPMIPPKWYRSMCCVNNETALKFVSMEACNQGIPHG